MVKGGQSMREEGKEIINFGKGLKVCTNFGHVMTYFACWLLEIATIATRL
jgi:hypothetical protein